MQPETIYYSQSENAVFKRCRRRWFLENVLRKTARDGEGSGALFVGTLVHVGMEAMRRAQMMELPWEKVQYEALRAIAERVEFDSAAGVVVDLKDVELALLMVEGYLDWYEDEGLGGQEEVVAVEQELSMELPNGVVYRGKIDAVVRRRDSGMLRVVDTKTVQSLIDPTLRLQMSEQLMGYVLLCEKHYGERFDGAEYSMLRKVKRSATAKPPFYGREVVRYGRVELEAFARRLQNVTDDAVDLRERLAHLWERGLPERAANLAYPSPDMDCSWRCPFTAQCELMNDPGSRWTEAVLQLDDHEPYARYGAGETETTE